MVGDDGEMGSGRAVEAMVELCWPHFTSFPIRGCDIFGLVVDGDKLPFFSVDLLCFNDSHRNYVCVHLRFCHFYNLFQYIYIFHLFFSLMNFDKICNN